MGKRPIGAIMLGMAALAASSGAAQRPRDIPAGPRSLPGDALPPFHMLDRAGRFVPVPPGFSPPPRKGPPAPESTAVGPGLELSIRLASAAIRACARRGFPVGVAVIDMAGEARAMLTADTSDGSHVFVAHRKAIAAVAFAMPTSQALKQVENGRGLRKVTPAMFVNVGGVPIWRHGRMIGAIGVSGGHGVTTDEDCANDALKALGRHLG